MQLTTEKQDRKERPIARGVLDYFPLAIAEVAKVSYVGNQQHNPGEEMHWSRGKSNDHADCIARHLIERGTIDTDGLRHSAKIAWRALALLQLELEAETPTETPDSSDKYTPKKMDDVARRGWMWRNLMNGGCPAEIAGLIADGTSFTHQQNVGPSARPFVYIAGPMRGIKDFNFPAFDAARDKRVAEGCNVISPADIDRAADDKDSNDQARFALRDFHALHFLRTRCSNGQVHFLPGWEKSTGARAEYHVAQWLGLFIVEVTP
jgi:hypothetical protein